MRFALWFRTLAVTALVVFAGPARAQNAAAEAEMFGRTVCRIYSNQPVRAFLGQFFQFPAPPKIVPKVMSAADLKGGTVKPVVVNGQANRVYVESGLRLQPIFNGKDLVGITVSGPAESAPAAILELAGPGCGVLKPVPTGGKLLPYEWVPAVEDQIFRMIVESGILQAAR